MDLRDAAGFSFAIGEHGLAIRRQVVVGVGATRGAMVKVFGLVCCYIVPAAETNCLVIFYAAVKADAGAVFAPEFVFVPFVCVLSWNGRVFASEGSGRHM